MAMSPLKNSKLFGLSFVLLASSLFAVDSQGFISTRMRKPSKALSGGGSPPDPPPSGNQITLNYTSNDSNGRNIYNDAQDGTFASPVWDGSSPVDIVITVQSGVTIGAPNNSTPAITIPTGFPVGTTIVLSNQGTIIGAGGNGGFSTANGQNGGTALRVEYQTTVNNSGLIYGGGGGGGGGGTSTYPDAGAQGGGGAGFIAGTGGTGATTTTGAVGSSSSWGGPAGGGAGCPGGNGGTAGQVWSGDGQYYATGGGGGGGNPGCNGGSGGHGQLSNQGSGGLAGFYVDGNAHVVWGSVGTTGGRVQ